MLYCTKKPKKSFATSSLQALKVRKYFVFWYRTAFFWFLPQKDGFLCTFTAFLHENNTKCARFAVSLIIEDEGVGGLGGRRVGG